ncbi:MAG: McbB family protein, partial [Lactobacillus iners]|nr:McbB family protein [Lactobacillus iners]
MNTYLIPQFLILNNDINNAVIQNKNGINYLTNRSIISFFNKVDELHKNLVTEQFLEDFFGLQQYKSTLQFMLDAKLLEEKVEYYSAYKSTVIFTNNKTIYNLMSKVINEKNDTISSYCLNTFQSDQFQAKIEEISDDSLIITIFSPLDFNEYTWLCDFL